MPHEQTPLHNSRDRPTTSCRAARRRPPSWRTRPRPSPVWTRSTPRRPRRARGGAGRCPRAAPAGGAAAVPRGLAARLGVGDRRAEYKIPAPADVWHAFCEDRRRRQRLVDPLDVDQPGVRRVRRRAGDRDPAGAARGEGTVVRAAIGPLVSGLQSLPSVAWVPAAVIWFGLTDATIYFVVLPARCRPSRTGCSPASTRCRRSCRASARCSGRAAGRRPAHPAAGRAARLPRGLQAGLGVLVALADGGRDHRRRPALGSASAPTSTRQRLQRHAVGDRRHLPDPHGRHRRSSCWCSGPSSAGCCVRAAWRWGPEGMSMSPRRDLEEFWPTRRRHAFDEFCR